MIDEFDEFESSITHEEEFMELLMNYLNGLNNEQELTKMDELISKYYGYDAAS
ncbi:MAG: hypothetical protein ACTSRP_08250 [Candidatus Helarchaeota archaeon]